MSEERGALGVERWALSGGRWAVGVSPHELTYFACEGRPPYAMVSPQGHMGLLWHTVELIQCGFFRTVTSPSETRPTPRQSLQ